MATNNIDLITKQEWSFQSASYVPTGNNDLSTGSPTVVALTLANIAAGSAVNSDQVNLGSTRPDWISVRAALEWFAAVVADEVVSLWWSGSANSNAAAGNPGNPDGTDGAYVGDGSTVLEGVVQMQKIGNHRNNGKTGLQIADSGGFRPYHQFGQLVVVNETQTTLCLTDDIESSILFYGTINNVAAAV